jgi:hypothetical protein
MCRAVINPGRFFTRALKQTDAPTLDRTAFSVHEFAGIVGLGRRPTLTERRLPSRMRLYKSERGCWRGAP